MSRLAHMSRIKIHKEPEKDKGSERSFRASPGVTRMGVIRSIAEFFRGSAAVDARLRGCRRL